MECKRCLSGYRVNQSGNESYCGYCGARLKGLEARFKLEDDLIYLDSQLVELTLEVSNVGVVEAHLERVEFDR